jgi:hypothetical protein
MKNNQPFPFEKKSMKNQTADAQPLKKYLANFGQDDDVMSVRSIRSNKNK